MTSKGHKKHASMVKPVGGKFHRNEFAVLGAPCGLIQDLTTKLSAALNEYNIGYVDADHGEGKADLSFACSYTDKIGSHQLNYHSAYADYEFRGAFEATDAVLVNGNHFKAGQQVVLINAKKAESLERKLDRLINVLFFVLDEGEEQLHDFLLEHNPDFAQLPVFKLDELDAMAEVLRQTIDRNKPALKGLVLAGGKSERMGYDKGEIGYHGKPQREYMADLLAGFTTETFISAQDKALASAYPIITDSFLNLGPFGGILSAMRSDPNAAWITVATDIPLLDQETLEILVQHRNPSKVATCFHNPETGFPEPLITIWEPRAYARLLYFMQVGYSCPRKVLINSDIEEVNLSDTKALLNANTPEEEARLKAMIQSK